MAVLAERYMRDYVPSHCRVSSAEVYRWPLDNHILPALGEMRVGAVGREQVTELHYTMRSEPHAANAVLKIVAKMLSLAVEWGMREHGPNPRQAVRKYRTHPRERFLTDEEYCRLGRAVDEVEAKGTVSLHAAAAIRLRDGKTGAHGAADTRRGQRAGRYSPGSGQPLGDCRAEAKRAHDQRQRSVAGRARPGRARRCTYA